MANLVVERQGVSYRTAEGKVERRYGIAETGVVGSKEGSMVGPESFFKPVAAYVVVRTDNGEPTIHAVTGINRKDFGVGAQLDNVPAMQKEVLLEALMKDEAAESAIKKRFTFSAGKYTEGVQPDDRVK